VRWPDEVRVDNYAMVATTRFAEKRVHAVLKRYGKETVMNCIREMLNRSERGVRAEISAIPDGTYSGEAATDDDGTVLDEQVWVRVDITVKGDSLTADFSRSDAQRKGFINCPYAASYAIAVGSMMPLFDPALADFHNEGSLRPITIITPPGSVVHPLYPATVGAAPVNVGQQIATSVGQALSKARPNRAMAGWGKHRGCYVSATDPRSGQPYVRTSFDYDGSAGAVSGYDGPTGPVSIGSLASVMRSNAEEMEIRFPWRMLNLETRPNFTGHGRWRGGGGVDWRAVNEGSDGRMSSGSSDGDVVQGKGALGGQRVPRARTFILRGDQKIRLKPHRLDTVKTGDVVEKFSSGGGGVGKAADAGPREIVRDPGQLLDLPDAIGYLLRAAADDGAGIDDGVPLNDLEELAGALVELVRRDGGLAFRRGDVARERAVVPHHGLAEVGERLLGGLGDVGDREAGDLVVFGTAAVVAQRLAVLLDLGRAGVDVEPEHGRAHKVEAVLPAKLERVGRQRRHPDRRMGLLHRLRADAEVVDLVELTFIAEAIFRPRLLDDLDALTEDIASARLVDAVAGEFVRLVAASDAEVDPAVGHEVDQREVFGDADGMIQRQDDDARTEAYRLRAGGDGGERDGGRGAVAVLAEVVFGGPDRIEPELLSAHHDVELFVDDLLLRPPDRILEQVKLAELHGVPPRYGCRCVVRQHSARSGLR